MTKRLLFYVHFNRYNQLSDHVAYQLKQMAPLFERVVLISNSHLASEDLAKLPHHDFIQRQNSGFDFSAWQAGLELVGFDVLSTYDSVTFMNDTTFGPLYDVLPYYKGYESDGKTDFWGITNHRATNKVKEHIQSYFVVYHKKILVDPVFKDFWQGIQNQSDVQEVISNYETSFTQKLQNQGFHYETILDTRKLSTEHMLHPDFSFWNPTQIVVNQVPFLKVKAVSAFKDTTSLVLDYVAKHSSYPMSLIYDHMSRYVELPDEKYLLANAYLSNPKGSVPKRIAIHLHVFYTDLLAAYLNIFETYPFDFDLFITTDSESKKGDIVAILAQFDAKASLHVTGNVGRDVLPMLMLKDSLSSYDVIGHFHTKKSKEADFLVGESWREELIEMLVSPADKLLSAFEDPHVGLIIADIPSFFRYNMIVNANNEAKIAPIMNDLWCQMGLNKTIDFEQLETFVMSYGTFVWFRYDALKPLFDMDLKASDVPSEPLPQNSILHAIERLLVYIAWGQFYDFKIAPSKPLTGFVDVKTMNHTSEGMSLDLNRIGGKRAAKYVLAKGLERVGLLGTVQKAMGKTK